jgi:hypothetical protein
MTADGHRHLRQTATRLERTIRVEAAGALDVLHEAHARLLAAVLAAGRARGYAGDDPGEALAAAAGPDPAVRTVGRAAADLWLAFFACFRPDEQAFEASHFRAAASELNRRIAQVPAGERPDPELAADLLTTLAELWQQRHAAISARLDDLIAQVSATKAGEQGAALASAQAADEVARVTALIAAAADATGAQVAATASPATGLAAVLGRMHQLADAERRRSKETVAAFAAFLAAVRAAAMGTPGPDLPPEATAVVTEVARLHTGRSERDARIAALERRIATLEAERAEQAEALALAAQQPVEAAVRSRAVVIPPEQARAAVRVLERAFGELVRALVELRAVAELTEDPARFRPGRSLLGLTRKPAAFTLTTPAGLAVAYHAAGADLAVYAQRAAWGAAVTRFARHVPALRTVCRELVGLVARWRQKLGDPPPVSISITLDGAEGVLALPAVLERDIAQLLRKKGKAQAVEDLAPLLAGAAELYGKALEDAGIALPAEEAAGRREGASVQGARLTARLSACAAAAQTAFAEAVTSGFRLTGEDADLGECGHVLRAGFLALDEAVSELAGLPGAPSLSDLPAPPAKGDAAALAAGTEARVAWLARCAGVWP